MSRPCDCSNPDCTFPVEQPTDISPLCLDRCDEHNEYECDECLLDDELDELGDDNCHLCGMGWMCSCYGQFSSQN